MAENATPRISLTADEFRAGLKVLEETKITPENAIDYIYDVLPYFNHHIVNEEVVMISTSNCVLVVQKMVEYLMTGNISAAIHTKGLDVDILEDLYHSKFSKPLPIEKIKNNMVDGEIGIIYIYTKSSYTNITKGHVFNVIKIGKRLLPLDGQKAIIADVNEYESLEYLKVK